MSELVNIYSDDIRGKVRKSPAWIKDAWVEFFDDVRAGFRDDYEKKKSELDDVELAFWSTCQTVADWNLAGKDGKKLPITPDSIRKLPLRLQRWVLEESTNAVLSDKEEKKDLPAT